MLNIPLGKRIRDARKAVGIAQERLGIEVGVSRPAIVQWESGAKRPNYERLCMLGTYGVLLRSTRRLPRSGITSTTTGATCPISAMSVSCSGD
ncbi:helix-turn-helix domain-containing protein [Modicisalibacter luteus]|uniref:Helix-turn-helix domain-containing protein n=1 Tax=Modicisalibacter luteus TaxID=453962 RepID=A0ABV7M6R7_9GAMM